MSPMEHTNKPDSNSNKESRKRNILKKRSFPIIKIKREKQGDDLKSEFERKWKMKKPMVMWVRKFFEPAALWQFLIAILTLFTLLWIIHSTNKQFRITETALMKSDSTTRESLRLIQKADSIAERSLIQSQQSSDSAYAIAKQTMNNGIEISQTDLRPYLYFVNEDTVSIRNILHLGIYKPFISIKNFGKTPAFNVECKWTMQISEHFDKEAITPYDLAISELESIIPPSDTYIISVSVGYEGIDQVKMNKINAGQISIYILMQLFYYQYLGNHQIERITQFCLKYDPETKKIRLYAGYDFDQ